MNTIQKITKNVSISGISQIIVSILAFVLLIYIARFLGTAEFGKYSFAVSFTSLFLIFADIGISQLIIREIARNKELASQYLTNASLMKILLSFITFGLIFLIINLMNYPADVKYIVYLFGIYTILLSFAQMFMSIFQAFEKMEYSAIILIVEKIIIISLGLLVLLLGYGLIELAYVYVIAGILEVIVGLSLVFKKITKPHSKIDLYFGKNITIDSISFAINGLFSILFFKIDTILLSIFKDDFAVGIYNAAYNPLLALSTVIVNMITSTIYPIMSKSFITSKDSLKIFTNLSVKYMAIIGFPIVVGCIVLADRFISIFYGNQYLDAILAFQILALFIPIRFINSITSTLLTSINKQNIRTFIICIGAIFNIILNIILIPKWSYIGASIATVLSELFLYIGFIYYIRKYYADLNIHSTFTKPIIASLALGILLYLFKEINLFLVIILATLAYLLILILLQTFDSKDKYILSKLIKK